MHSIDDIISVPGLRGTLVSALYVFFSDPLAIIDALNRCTNSFFLPMMSTPSVQVSSLCVMSSGSSLPTACSWHTHNLTFDLASDASCGWWT